MTSLAKSKAKPRRREPVNCPDCKVANSVFDQYCGQCGAPLSKLLWRPVGSAHWREGSGKLAVAERDPVAQIEYRLEGVVPRAFVVQDPEPEESCRWIDDGSLRHAVYTPGEEPSILDIPLHREQLGELFEKERGERLEDRNELLARLPLLTSRGRSEGGRYAVERLVLDLVVARQPWAEPGASLYRFLPIERLREQGIRHLITLHDEATAEPVEILGYELRDMHDEGVAAPHPYHPIKAEDVIDISRSPARRSPTEQPQHLVYLQAPDLTLPEDQAGWFSALVTYDLSQGAETYSISTQISGVVGRGPTLMVGEEGETRISRPSPSRHEEILVPVVNPGDLPVRLVDLKVLNPDGDEVSERDWLIVEGLQPGQLFSSGEERSLRLRFNRRARPARELNEEHNFRKIVLEHDGWASEARDRRLVLDVAVLFGAFDVHHTLGIDFGTSSSVVCLMGQRRGFPLELEKDGEARHALASLMYYDHLATGRHGRDIFLFGEEARNAANLMPANLVRSIKTIVAENAEERYLLIKESKGKNIFFETRTAQELLNRFITELVELSEEGASALKPRDRREAGIRDEQLSFRHAVFSHPVDVTASMQAALLQAAHASFLNEPLEEVEQFFAESCVDEATAAVLAYIHGRLFAGVAEEYKLQDQEKVVCFDMGGGTTDLAAVEVENMVAITRKEVDHVTVRPVAQGGDRTFGGDLLDRLIAIALLRKIREQSEELKCPIRLTELELAISARNFTNYQIGYKDRAGRKAARKGQVVGDTSEAEAAALYNLAAAILGTAEEIKRKLSAEKEASAKVRSSDWPYETAPQERDKAFEVSLGREDLGRIAGGEITPRLRLMDTLVERAGWKWTDVTTLLFTGQSVRSPVIRDLVTEHVQKNMRARRFQQLIVIHPDIGFDPKLCVAIGAAIWGISRQVEPWLVIDRERMGEQLPFDLTLGGPFFRSVEGLEHGALLPARGVLNWPTPKNHLELFKDGSPYVRFHFDPGQKLEIEVLSPTEVFLTVDERAGDRIKGRIQR